MNKYVITTILVVGLLTGIISLTIINKERNKNSNLLQESIRLREITSMVLKSFDNIITYDNVIISDVKLSDSDGKPVNISSIINSEKMVIYLPSIDCNKCSSKEIELLKLTFQKKYLDNIMIWGRFKNNREIKIFANSSGIKTYGITNESLFLPEGLASNPTLFLINSSLNAYCFFTTQNKESMLSEKYYQSILKRFTLMRM